MIEYTNDHSHSTNAFDLIRFDSLCGRYIIIKLYHKGININHSIIERFINNTNPIQFGFKLVKKKNDRIY